MIKSFAAELFSQYLNYTSFLVADESYWLQASLSLINQRYLHVWYFLYSVKDIMAVAVSV